MGKGRENNQISYTHNCSNPKGCVQFFAFNPTGDKALIVEKVVVPMTARGGDRGPILRTRSMVKILVLDYKCNAWREMDAFNEPVFHPSFLSRHMWTNSNNFLLPGCFLNDKSVNLTMFEIGNDTISSREMTGCLATSLKVSTSTFLGQYTTFMALCMKGSEKMLGAIVKNCEKVGHFHSLIDIFDCTLPGDFIKCFRIVLQGLLTDLEFTFDGCFFISASELAITSAGHFPAQIEKERNSGWILGENSEKLENCPWSEFQPSSINSLRNHYVRAYYELSIKTCCIRKLNHGTELKVGWSMQSSPLEGMKVLLKDAGKFCFQSVFSSNKNEIIVEGRDAHEAGGGCDFDPRRFIRHHPETKEGSINFGSFSGKTFKLTAPEMELDKKQWSLYGRRIRVFSKTISGIVQYCVHPNSSRFLGCLHFRGLSKTELCIFTTRSEFWLEQDLLDWNALSTASKPCSSFKRLYNM
jgi:hypothetical protein